VVILQRINLSLLLIYKLKRKINFTETLYFDQKQAEAYSKRYVYLLNDRKWQKEVIIQHQNTTGSRGQTRITVNEMNVHAQNQPIYDMLCLAPYLYSKCA